MEAFGTEPPGPGWTYQGQSRWTKEDEPVKVAIVGGGPGGLFTAYILNQRFPDANVVIFEASDRLGGKILTDSFSDGTPFEAGVAELYEYLGSGGKDPLRALIEDDLGLPTVNMRGGGVVLKDKVLRDLDDVEKEFGKATRESIEKFHERMAELMPLERYAHRWQPDNKHPWAPKTFRECIREECKDCTGVAYIETAVHSDLATESHTCNGLNGVKNVLLDNDKYMQLYHIVGGIGKLPEALVGKIRAGKSLEARVTDITKAGKRYMVHFTEDGDDEQEEFDAVIVAVPNHWLTQFKWSDEGLADAMHAVVAHYDLPAHYFRVSFLFETDWWREFGFPGDFWMMEMFNGCCAYDESHRWRAVGKSALEKRGHVLSFLLAGQDALLMCAFNQDEEIIGRHVLDSLPSMWRRKAEDSLLEVSVDAYAGSINAQPGGWPTEELRGEHQPAHKTHPGLFIVGDYLFDSTLNGALISASIAVDCLLEHLGVEGHAGTKAIQSLKTDKTGV